MSDPSNPLRLEVVGVLRNGRRRYDPASKQRQVEACLQPGVSLAGVALRHSVNANLLRKWVTGAAKAARGMARMAWRWALSTTCSCRLSSCAVWLVGRNRQLRLRSTMYSQGRAPRIRLRQG